MTAENNDNHEELDDKPAEGGAKRRHPNTLQVNYSDDFDLTRMVREHRQSEGVDWGNLSVVEYQDSDGKLQPPKMLISRDGEHAEMRLTQWLRNNGVHFERVKRIYSEYSPCLRMCDIALARDFPEAKVYYSFEYENADARAEFDAIRRVLALEQE